MPIEITPELIAAAIRGYELKLAELRAMLPGGSSEMAAAPAVPVRKRKVSAAARHKMAMAQKARWAKVRGEAEPAPKGAAKPKRRISKEGLARIVAATKKRWAAVRAAKAQQEKAAPKETVKRTTVKKAAATQAAG